MKHPLNRIKLSIWSLLFIVTFASVGLAQAVEPKLGEGREILLTLTVTSGQGSPIKELKPEHIKITSDKQAQQITYFSDKDEPISILFMIDTSGSMIGTAKDSNQLKYFIRSIKDFLQISNEKNEYAALSFNDEVRLLKSWTSDGSAVVQSLENLSTQPAKGQTALFDACRQGLGLMNDSKHRKRAIILLSDGQDNASKDTRLGKLLKTAKADDTIFYSVAIAWQDGNLDYRGHGILSELAKETGGLAFFPDTTFALGATFELMAMILRNQYVVGFKTSPNAADEKWHPVKVEIKLPPDAPRELRYPVVRHRAGYFDRLGEP